MPVRSKEGSKDCWELREDKINKKPLAKDKTNNKNQLSKSHFYLPEDDEVQENTDVTENVTNDDEDRKKPPAESAATPTTASPAMTVFPPAGQEQQEQEDATLHPAESTASTMTTNDKPVRCWWRPSREAQVVIPGTFEVLDNGETVVHMYANMGTRVVNDLSNVIVDNYENLLESMVKHFHVPEPTLLSLPEEPCEICNVLTDRHCVECKPPKRMCMYRYDCTQAHFNEIIRVQKTHPKHYKQDEFVRELFNKLTTTN